VQPDLLFVGKDRLSIRIENGTEGPPDLVVEIFSPSTRERDLGDKFNLYALSGVREYWIIDGDARQFSLFSLQGARFDPLPNDGQVARSAILPELEIDLTALFANLA
jgi:Uma2 family endonuclease